MKDQQNQKQSQADNSKKDPSKDLVSAAGQGQREGNQQSGQHQSGQQGGQQQGSQQSGQQRGNQQQGGGQHASGGTPALDDLGGQRQGESAQQAADAFQQQDQPRGKR